MNSAFAAARKQQLRRELRATRAAIDRVTARHAARRAARHLMCLPALWRARAVSVYLAHGSELDTRALIAALHRAGKTVWVPGVQAGEGRMRMLRLAPGEALRRRRFGIREPARRRAAAPRLAPDIVILPLTGFDARGTRLGSGGGYYDRWLARLRPRPFLVGYAYVCQGLPSLPREPWDQPLDAVCTERGLRRFARR